ncbi:hypothetical protein FOFC_02625 [Fusarium oxysporum]|nr:hypothetical protein FOFC_02625 [Fusarium oxysporum]
MPSLIRHSALLNPSFIPTSIDGFSYSKRKLERQWSCSLHMARWADRLVFDTLGDLCFGEFFGMKEHDSELRHIPPTIKDFISTILPIANSPFTSLCAWLKPRGLDYLLAAAAPPAMSKW